MRFTSWAVGLFILTASIGCYASIDEPEQSETGQNNPSDIKMWIDLRTESATIKQDTYPNLTAVLVNDGSQAVSVVLPGDGSTCGWRTPVIRWNPEQQRSQGRCGNINALKPGEVVLLEPGKRIDVSQWIGPPTLGLGKHRITLEYENIPDLKWKGLPLGDHDPATMEKVRQSTRFKAVSNVLEIQVEE